MQLRLSLANVFVHQYEQRKIKGNRTKQLNNNIRCCIDVTLCDHNSSCAEIPFNTVTFLIAGHILY